MWFLAVFCPKIRLFNTILVQIDDIILVADHPIRLITSDTDPVDSMVQSVAPGFRLGKEAGGRPYLSDENGQTRPCSITHTTGFRAFCVATSGQVGLDAERRDRIVHPKLKDRMRHPEEPIELYAEPLKLWTLKESVLKCTGKGLRVGMKTIHLHQIDDSRFLCEWNGHEIHGILIERHDVWLSLAYTTSTL